MVKKKKIYYHSLLCPVSQQPLCLGWISLCKPENKERNPRRMKGKELRCFIQTNIHRHIYIYIYIHILIFSLTHSHFCWARPPASYASITFTHIPTHVHIGKPTYTFGWMDGWIGVAESPSQTIQPTTLFLFFVLLIPS